MALRIGAHAPLALGGQRRDLGGDPAVLVEQLLGAVRAHPRLERREVLGVLGQLRQRHLVGAEGALHRLAVDLLGPRPALGRAQDDHRPARPLGVAFASTRLDGGDVADHLVERLGHELVHGRRVVALHEVGLVAVADEQRAQLVVRDARQDGRVGDLVAVEVQDRQHRAVARRVHELVGVPAGRERTGLRLAVAHDAADEQVGVVERRSVGVDQRVAQLAALVDRARRLGRDVARDAAGEGELPEQPAQALLVGRHARVDLGVSALEVGAGHEAGTAVPGPGDEDGVEVVGADDAVEVRVDEVQPGRRAPVAQQARLDVLDAQRLAQERVGEQVDLADRQVVRGAPPGVQALQLVGGERAGRGGRLRLGHDHEPYGLALATRIALT